MAVKPHTDQQDREGLQLALPDTAPEVVSPQAGLLYSQSTRQGKHKEPYAYQEYRIDGHGQEAQELASTQQKRICGLKRRTAILLLVVALVIIAAVVLGSTLGTLLDNKTAPQGQTQSSSTSPLSVQRDTGIAVIPPTSSQEQAYGYYQDESNNVIEAQINDGVWTFPDGTTAQDNIVTSDAYPGSPLAALPWSFRDVEYRLLFFINNENQLASTNRTSARLWSSTKVILTDSSALLESGTIALDAFVVPDFHGSDALRVYFGSVVDGIREVGWGHLTETPGFYWPGDASGFILDEGDSSTGIGATSTTDKSLNIYLRNSSTGCVTQWNYGYGSFNDEERWQIVTATNSPDINPGSDITACADPKTGVDYIFYQNTSGKIVMRTSETVPLDSTTLEPSHVFQKSAAYNSKLRALCDENTSTLGPVIYYQDPNSTTQLSYLRASSDGSVAASGVVLS